MQLNIPLPAFLRYGLQFVERVGLAAEGPVGNFYDDGRRSTTFWTSKNLFDFVYCRKRLCISPEEDALELVKILISLFFGRLQM